MAPLLRFETAERGFARNVVERHSPQAGFNSDRLVDSGTVHSASGPVLLERRDATGNSSDTPVANIPSVTESTKALVGIIVFLGVVVLAVAGLRLRKFLLRRRSKNPRSSHLKTLSLCDSPRPVKIVSEKRNPLYTQTLLDFGYDGLQPPSKVWATNAKPVLVYSDSEDRSVGWRPQVDSWSEDIKEGWSPDVIPRPFLPPPLPAVLRQSRFSRLTSKFSRSPKPSALSFEVDAAPPYTSAAPTPRNNSPALAADSSAPLSDNDVSVKSSPSPKRKQQRRTPPPIRVDGPSTKISRVPVPHIDPAPVPDITVTEAPQTVTIPEAIELGNAVKSPSRLDSAKLDEKNSDLHVPKTTKRCSRKSLFSLKRPSSDASSSESDTKSGEISSTPGKKLPRLVVAISTFTPNLEDELPIRVGEVFRMMHEFRDGWCAVERLAKEDEHGVVPRFCVADRLSIIPDGAKVERLTNTTPLTFTGSSTSDQPTQGMN